MESLGSLLTKAREQKKWTLDDLMKRTRISKKFLDALEKENYGALPGEIYTKGFIHNVAVALGLDPEQLVEIYKRTKRSEEPAPYEELFKKTAVETKKFFPFVVTGAGAVLLIAIIIILVKMNSTPKMQGASFSDSGGHEKNIVEDRASVQVRSGDTVFFRPLGVSATIKIISVGNTVKAMLNETEVTLSKGNPVVADLNKNNYPDFRISFVDVMEDLAMIEFEKIPEAMVESNTAPVVTNALGTVEEQPRFRVVGDTTYLVENTDKAAIRVNLTAKNFVYVRYFVDAEKPQVKSLPAGKMLDLTGADSIQLTIGNAGSLVVKVNEHTMNFGKEGEVVNKTIKWIKNPDNETKYHLIIVNTK